MQMTLFRRRTFGVIFTLGAVMLASLSFAAEPKKAATADVEFGKMDTNGDGKISTDEHAAAAKQMFETMDKNKDGKVTAAEMKAGHQRVTGRKATKSDMNAADKIKVVDTDRDGVLTAEEHAAGSRAMFEKMDANKDGFLTKDELAAGHARMLKKPHARCGP
jgi:Ca2+-binding EF-hand superfamily protein